MVYLVEDCVLDGKIQSRSILNGALNLTHLNQMAKGCIALDLSDCGYTSGVFQSGYRDPLSGKLVGARIVLTDDLTVVDPTIPTKKLFLPMTDNTLAMTFRPDGVGWKYDTLAWINHTMW